MDSFNFGHLIMHTIKTSDCCVLFTKTYIKYNFNDSCNLIFVVFHIAEHNHFQQQKVSRIMPIDEQCDGPKIRELTSPVRTPHSHFALQENVVTLANTNADRWILTR